MSLTDDDIVVFWFRRDLRLHDNAGLSAALTSGHRVLPLFIFDTEILDKLSKDDARVTFIGQTLQKMRAELQKKYGSSILIQQGHPAIVFKKLLHKYQIKAVFTNHDYEAYAQERDVAITKLLQERSIPLRTFKDQVIFEKNEVTKDDGLPYVVYTPYMRKWKSTFNANAAKAYPTLLTKKL